MRKMRKKSLYWIAESSKPVWKVMLTSPETIDMVKMFDTEKKAESFLKRLEKKEKENE